MQYFKTLLVEKLIAKTRLFSPSLYYLHDKANVEVSIGNINSSKVGTFKNIPIKCIKVTSDICSLYLEKNQQLIINKEFPQKLKLTGITPVYKKEDSTKVIDSKIIDLLVFYLHYQKSSNSWYKNNQFLSPFLCGYRKSFSTQTALVWLTEM